MAGKKQNKVVTNVEGRLSAFMLAPKYWGTWCALLLLWLIMWLPRTWVMRMGNWLGDRVRQNSAKRRHITKVNIRLCFPELSQEHRRQMLIDHFRCYGRGLLDMGLVMMGSKKRIKMNAEVLGMEYITSNLDSPGVILVTFHATTMEMCSCSILMDTPLVSMMKRDSNPVINRFLYRARTRFNNAKVYMREQSLRGILKGMNEGRLCFLVPDEDFGEGKHTVYAPFFGQLRSTLNIVGRIASRTGAVVVPCFCRLDAQTGRYTTTVSPPLTDFPGNNFSEDAVCVNNAMEKLIREVPEQYLWTFRWFKTRPGGLLNPYDKTGR